MDEAQTLAVEVEFAGIQSKIVRTSYAHGGATALVLVDAADDSPVITASINVAGVSEALPEDHLALKTYSEGEGLLEALEAAGVVEDTAKCLQTGFVSAPIVRLLL